MTTHIAQIEHTLNLLKSLALAHLNVPDEVAQTIQLADPPDPSMGDRGFPTFALAKLLKQAPPKIAQTLVEHLQSSLIADYPIVAHVSAAGPYVNFTIRPSELARITLSQILREEVSFGADFLEEQDRDHVMIEFSAPNTNKPQHLGHVRNNLLGESVSRIIKHSGKRLTRVNLINDRGIHICKSMLAYTIAGNGESPESSGIKGDHLVGKYYVEFDRLFREEFAKWQQTDSARFIFQKWCETPRAKQLQQEVGDDQEALKKAFAAEYKDQYFNERSELGRQAREMLLKWEANDPDTIALWKMMNSWVFQGFDQTYARLGIKFDQVYYESNTYKLGKDIVYKALDDGLLHKLDNGAIACDLASVGLPQGGDKVLLRGDGTSVYMTQDLGTALQRFEQHAIDQMIYVVGDEQNYHFQVLFAVLAKLDAKLSGRLAHLSYGMVELPDGKMKSREGNVVDADDLMDIMTQEATSELAARFPDLDPAELTRRAEIIGLAAIKYFILDFHPRTTVHFDPKKSLEFTGRTGPYALYTYARIQSIGREVGGWPSLDADQLKAACEALGTDIERNLVKQLATWPHTLRVAARDLDPSKITDYIFHTCKAFNLLYNDPEHRIKPMPPGPRRDALLAAVQATALAIAAALELLGIQRLEAM